MTITTALSTVGFKQGLLEGRHNFRNSGGSTFKMALIKASESGTYGAGTSSYTTLTGNSDEVSGTGYSAGGATLTRIDPTVSGTTAYTDFGDVSWSTATFTTNGALLYNDTDGNDSAVFVYSFGSTQTVTAGTFTLQFPTADSSSAILRIA